MKTLFLKTGFTLLFVFALLNSSRAAGTISASNTGMYNITYIHQDSVLTIETGQWHYSNVGQATGEIYVNGSSMTTVDFDIYLNGNLVTSYRGGGASFIIDNLAAGTYHLTITGPVNSDSQDVTITEQP